MTMQEQIIKGVELPHAYHSRTKHGMVEAKIYKVWSAMKDRCTNSACPHFANYGGRGIKLCGKWMTFSGFWEDVQDRYVEGLELDRIDNSGNYELSNIQWVSHSANNRNKRTNHVIDTPKGAMCLAAVEEAFGLKRGYLAKTLHGGKTEKEIYEYLKKKLLETSDE
jgi:hypothetical protein